MRIELQPYTEISKYLETNDTILMPIGALEQYGPHLAIGTELRIVDKISQDAAEKANLAVAPVVPFNYSHMFLDFPGTMSAEMHTIEDYVGQIADGLASQGFRRFLFVNIHAGSLGPLESICRSLRSRWGCVGGLIDVFSVMRDVADVKYETQKAPTGHGSEMVTSVALHLAPELVSMDKIEKPAELRSFVDGVKTLSSGKVSYGKSSFQVFSNISDYAPLGVQGDASGATAEKGKIIFDSACDYIADAAGKFSAMVLNSEAGK